MASAVSQSFSCQFFRRILSVSWVLVKGQKLLGEFEAVMQENNNSMKITEQKEWWSRRRALNAQLEVFFLYFLVFVNFHTLSVVLYCIPHLCTIIITLI